MCNNVRSSYFAVIGVARILSELGSLFFPEKVDDLLVDALAYLNNLSQWPDLPNFVKNGHSLPRGALTTFHCKVINMGVALDHGGG